MILWCHCILSLRPTPTYRVRVLYCAIAQWFEVCICLYDLNPYHQSCPSSWYLYCVLFASNPTQGSFHFSFEKRGVLDVVYSCAKPLPCKLYLIVCGRLLSAFLPHTGWESHWLVIRTRSSPVLYRERWVSKTGVHSCLESCDLWL